MKGLLTIALRLVTITAVIFNDSYAQELAVGDRLPNTKLAISGFTHDSINLASTGKKLTILDFWSHGCISCLKSFPKLDSLQQKFGRYIQIILVNLESADSTRRFFSLRKKLVRPHIPLISGDSLLFQLFPHQYVPYHIWIDSNGIVSYKANSDIATSRNIQHFLSGLKLKEFYDYKQKSVESLFDANFRDRVEQFSYLSRCIQGAKLVPEKRAGSLQVSYSCMSIGELILRVFSRPDYFRDTLLRRPGRMVFDVTNPVMFFRPTGKDQMQDFFEKYSYDYHIQIPDSLSGQLSSMMQNDLMRYFNLDIFYTKRTINCLTLTRTSTINKLTCHSTSKRNTFTWADERSTHLDSIRSFLHLDYRVFSKQFGNYIEAKFNLPFFDETGLSGLIDISLNGQTIDAANLNSLKGELQHYDLDLLLKHQTVDVLVIKEKQRERNENN